MRGSGSGEEGHEGRRGRLRVEPLPHLVDRMLCAMGEGGFVFHGE
jgi:hypothetical protein